MLVILCLFRLFEDAASKLNLVGLVGFLHQLRKASQSQLFDSVTETGDYSLAMPGNSPSRTPKPSHSLELGDGVAWVSVYFVPLFPLPNFPVCCCVAFSLFCSSIHSSVFFSLLFFGILFISPPPPPPLLFKVKQSPHRTAVVLCISTGWGRPCCASCGTRVALCCIWWEPGVW